MLTITTAQQSPSKAVSKTVSKRVKEVKKATEIISNNPKISHVYPKIPRENSIKKHPKVLIKGTHTKNKELLIDIAGLKNYSTIRFNARLNQNALIIRTIPELKTRFL
jgi:hypothetical protein